mgnify:CR=1 FL=1
MPLPWPSPAFKSSCQETLFSLGKVSQDCFKLVCRALGMKKEGFERYIAHSLSPVRHLDKLSTSSVVEMFRYLCPSRASGASPRPFYRVQCAEHSDVSLFTLIPAPRCYPGLQMYNWGESGWQAVEEQVLDARECIIFPGEMLSHISNNFICATPHRVVVLYIPSPWFLC